MELRVAPIGICAAAHMIDCGIIRGLFISQHNLNPFLASSLTKDRWKPKNHVELITTN